MITAEQTVCHGENTSWIRSLLTLEGDAGLLEANYFPSNGEYLIHNFRTATPRAGHGKALLQRVLVEAGVLGADRITANITSPESLASMSIIFGADSIDVKYQGSFEEQFGTFALLSYTLPIE